MRRFALVLVMAVLAATGSDPGAAADDELVYLDLTGARVLASPGWPAALEGFLPPGREVEPLTLPLPPGPLLVLGLWDSDPAARELGLKRFHVDPSRGLGGGYVVAAHREGEHAVAMILAQDAAALAAARFELETFLPEAKADAPRSLDMTRPDEQASMRIVFGRRAVRPRFRIRALGGLRDGDTPLDAASAHANRLWYGPGLPPPLGRPSSFALLRQHGVEPVAFTSISLMDAALVRSPRRPGGTRVDHEVVARVIQRDIYTLGAWQDEGVRHFAILLEPLAAPESDHAREIYAAVVRRIVQALRPGGLRELLVIPPHGSKRAALPDLSGIPEAMLGWRGSYPHALRITRDEAAQVTCAARVPVVLVETWMERVHGLPSMPRGRDEDLGEVLAGIVVLPGPAAADALARAWAPGAPEPSDPPALEELLACCASEPADAEAFLLGTAANLEQALSGRFADPHWLRQLPGSLRRAASELPVPAQRVMARYVDESPTLDGRLSEPAWSDTPVTRLGAAEVRALSDGERLTLGLRVPVSMGVRMLTLRVGTDLPAGRGMLHFWPAGSRLSGDPAFATTLQGAAHELEVAFGHYPLGGDPHPGRVIGLALELTTQTGTHGLAPESWSSRTGGVVVVIR